MKHKPPDLILLFLVLILAAIGILMVFSASTSTALSLTRNHPDPYYFLKRQSLWLIFGALGAIAAYKINLDLVRKLTPWLFLATLLGLAVVLVPGIGREAGGARRWLAVGPLSLQPSEICKITLVLFVAWFMTRTGSISTSFFKTVLPTLIIVTIAAGLVFKEPDFGTAVLLLVILGLMLWSSGMPWSYLAVLGGAFVPVAVGLMLTAHYRMTRWTSFWNPWRDPLGGGYHIIQGLIALGSGGVFGLGLGAGKQKFFYLPEQHTDYIFAVLGEEGGFVATAVVLVLFFCIAVRGMNIALKQKDAYGKMLASGFTFCLVGQALLNMAMVASLIPPAGIALPFLSYGGSSLFATMIMVGFLLNLSRAPSGVDTRHGLQEKIFLERT